MSAASPPVPAGRATSRPAASRPVGVTQVGVLRAEWIKLRSLRSTLLTALFAAGSMLLMGVVGATDFSYDWERASAAERAGLDPLHSLLSGWFLAQVLIGVIGALAVTSEYASGSIVSTLSAVPRRTPVLVAKLLIPALVALVVMVPATLAGLVLGDLLLPTGVSVDLGASGVLRAVVGVGVAMAAVCAIGAALGFLVRSTAGAIGILVVVLLVVPTLAAGISPDLERLLPSGAIKALVTVDRAAIEDPPLAWPAGLALLTGYVMAAARTALLVLRRRDA
jgi:ABC-2 type transport system permease protein